MVQFGTDTGGVVLNFGGWGDQDGLFKTPVSMEAVNGDILVLDSETGAVSVFGLTAFGRAIHEATALYGQGLYPQSILPWQEVLRLDNNYAMAYRGLGKAYYQMEDYPRAMEAFRLGNDKQGYSDAYKEYSLLKIRANMGYILGGIVLAAVVAALFLPADGLSAVGFAVMALAWLLFGVVFAADSRRIGSATFEKGTEDLTGRAVA